MLEIHSPPLFMTSFVRSVSCTCPCWSMHAMSPVQNQPSSVTLWLPSCCRQGRSPVEIGAKKMAVLVKEGVHSLDSHCACQAGEPLKHAATRTAAHPALSLHHREAERLRKRCQGWNPAYPEVLARDVQAAHLQLALRAPVVRLHAPRSVHQPEVHKKAGAPLHGLQMTLFHCYLNVLACPGT